MEAERLDAATKATALNPDLWDELLRLAGIHRLTVVGQGACRPSGKRAVRPAGRRRG